MAVARLPALSHSVTFCENAQTEMMSRRAESAGSKRTPASPSSYTRFRRILAANNKGWNHCFDTIALRVGKFNQLIWVETSRKRARFSINRSGASAMLEQVRAFRIHGKPPHRFHHFRGGVLCAAHVDRRLRRVL